VFAKLGVLVLLVPALYSQAAPALTAEQMETFLQKATIKSQCGAKKGVTGTTRATIADEARTKDASTQTIDEMKARFESPNGTEYNLKDSYKLNIAALSIGAPAGAGLHDSRVDRTLLQWQAGILYLVD